MNQQTNKIKDDMISTLQGLVADDELKVDFVASLENNFFSWNQNNLIVDNKILLPAIKEHDSYEVARAAVDVAVGYILFHDPEIYATHNLNFEEQKIFDEFEKVRLLANISEIYLGSAKNILEKLDSDLDFADFKPVYLLLLKELFATKISDKIKVATNVLEQKLSAEIISKIKNLKQKIHNQEAFQADVEHILELIKKDEENKNNSPQDNKSPEEELKNDVNFNEENIEEKPQEGLEDAKEQDVSSVQEELKEKNQEIKKVATPGALKINSTKQDYNFDKIEYRKPYKIFSDRFDEVIFPQKLISKAELDVLRMQLDLKMAKLSGISKKMSLKLKRKLLSKKDFLIERDSSRGLLDKKKLTRLVLDPMLEDIWVNSKAHEYNDVALTILLDNSGSMRGNPITMSAMVCEIIAEILEKFSVKTEIIGFTTGDWKGGRARKLWESSGRKPNPGRLNELRHIIYKSFNQNFKKSKTNLGLMLKDGILKENIDGEALLFARSRLMQQSEKRKILMVISDGTPVDDSTTSANDNEILSDHLKSVINNIEKKTNIEIVGVGIGHATDEFYENSITVRTLDDLGDAMIEKLTNLL